MNYESKYICTGRRINSYIGEDNLMKYVVKNGFKTYELSEIEYIMWTEISNFTSGDHWITAIEKELIDHPSLNAKGIFQAFLSKNLIQPWEFERIEDPLLVSITITRNGYPHGLVNDEWIISDFSSKNQMKLSREAFYVWTAAASSACLLEVIDILCQMSGVSVDEALGLVRKNGPELIAGNLWSAEYFNLQEVE